jgi:beta-xylosidase
VARDWTWSQPAWPSKAAATSPTSGDAMVWAPSVVKGRDGRWWMYVSVGSEVWVGSAPAPGGPWADANHGRPLIPGNFRPGFHMIDAEAFIDRDGQAWLAWGSGLNWVNGHCFVVRLAADMVHFAGPVEDVTPTHYFEAPFLLRAGAGYVLSYSAGNTTRDTYQVRYATGPSPRGPFTEAPNSPILQTQPGDAIISPGHHAFSAAAAARSFSIIARPCPGAPASPKRCARSRSMDLKFRRGHAFSCVAAGVRGRSCRGGRA